MIQGDGFSADPAASLWERANAAYAKENFDEAEKLFVENAAEQERAQTPNVANMIESYEKAGRSAQKARRYQAAIGHLEKAVEDIDQRQDPIRWAEMLDNLAYVWWDASQYLKAEVIWREVAKQREESLGVKHTDTITSRNNVACVLFSQGQYAEAETQGQAAMKLREEVLGKDHPDTLKTRTLLELIAKKK